MNHSMKNTVCLTLALFFLHSVANAHFVWLAPVGEDQIEVYFGELAEADDPDLLERLQGLQAFQITPNGEMQSVKSVRKNDALMLQPVADAAVDQSAFIATHDFGVLSRGDESFRLLYYAKTAPKAKSLAEIDTAKKLPLNIVPKIKQGKILATISWQGEPLAGAQLIANGPGMKTVEVETDKKGRVVFDIGEPGLVSIRVRHIEETAGKWKDKTFSQIRHYSTVSLLVEATPADKPNVLFKMPTPLTSFGAAVVDDDLYLYGGFTGAAHDYSQADQSNELRRLSITNPRQWKSVATGPKLQGLALESFHNNIYRFGGFTAKNQEGEDDDLWSQASVAVYDTKKQEWRDLAELPEPRSSFDSALLGDTVYVVGGWKMAGKGADPVWHKTAWKMNLADEKPSWRAIADPPFQRRAVAVASHAGKIYVIGGMQEKGGPTKRVDIYDPSNDKWSTGPALIGEEELTGFGASAFENNDRLYVSNINGELQQLAEDGSAWKVVKQLPTARFFHQMLPRDKKSFLMIGGANMRSGKFDDIEIVEIP